MSYSLNSREIIENINPINVVTCLRNIGWKIFPRKNESVKILQYEKNEELFQVQIPMDKELVDYEKAMYESILTVAKVEEKSLENTLLYFMNPNADVLKIRLDRKDVESGYILIDDAINIYENTKKLLSAAAQDVLHPKNYHQGRVESDIQKFLSGCKFGQTEVGSYVVSVICPFVNDDAQQTSIFSDEEERANSLSRKVTSRVMENLVNIKKYIDDGDLDKLTQDSSCRISANFYEALRGLNLQTEGARVEFFAEWSPSVQDNPKISNRVLLTHDYCQPMETVIRKLKGHTKKATSIIGRITKLESSPDVRSRDKGKITVKYLNEQNRVKSLVAELNTVDYKRALEAHEKGWYIKLTGELVAKKTAMMKCEAFDVVDAE